MKEKYILVVASALFLFHFLSFEISAPLDWETNHNAYIGMACAMLIALSILSLKEKNSEEEK